MLNKFALLVFPAIAACLAVTHRANADEFYTVVSGDTVCEIAERFSIPCAAVIETNKLGEGAMIFVGQRLILPVLTAIDADVQSTKEGALEDSPPLETTDSPTSQVNEKSQVVAPTTLWPVYVLARSNDPTFQAHRLRRNAARQAFPQARATFRPQLRFESNLTRTYDDDFDDSDSLQTSISLNQRIYNRSGSIAVEQANHRILSAESNYREARQDLILKVAKAYFAVLAMSDNLELSQKNQEAIGRQLDLALERLNAGIGTRTDLFDAEARYESAVADGIDAAKLLDDAAQGLVLLTGSNPGPLSSIRAHIKLQPPHPNEPDIWVSASLKNNHRLRADRHSLEIARLEAAKQRADRLPSLDANLNSGFTDTNETDSSRTSFSLRLSVPLVQGGLLRSQIKEADLVFEAEIRDYEASRRSIYTETRGAFLSISSRLRRIEALAGAIRAGESALRAKEEGFAAGINTSMEILDGQRVLLQAERDYLKERYDYILGMLELEALVGDLTEEDLHRIDAWLK